MNIGTGKDLDDYIVEGTRIPYHLIDIAEPTEEYNLFRFKTDFYKSFNEIKKRGKTPFLCGGTGLYLSSVLQNYDLRKADFPAEKIKELENRTEAELSNMLLKLKPKQHNITNLENKDRMIKAILIAQAENIITKNVNTSISSLNVGITLEREVLKKRITERLKKRIDEGMIEEVRNLLERGVEHSRLLSFGLEYKLVSQHLQGKLNYNDMYQKLNSAIYKFAKRQMTWFRKMEREGVLINWFDGSDYNQISNFIRSKI